MKIEEAIKLYCEMYSIDITSAKQRYTDVLNHYNGKGCSKWAEDLRNKWYEALDYEDAAYRLYDDDWYFCDLLACYKIYSSEYIKKVGSLNLTVDTCLDLGCGLGLTTKALEDIGCGRVVGTNLKGTKQYDFCASHIDVLPDHKEAGPVDLVFASEYFEHIYHAGDHLIEILEVNKPKVIVMANAFNAKSFGHFDYFYNLRWSSKVIPLDSYIHHSKMGRMFANILKQSGYEKVKTGFWNDRPNVWEKN